MIFFAQRIDKRITAGHTRDMTNTEAVQAISTRIQVAKITARKWAIVLDGVAVYTDATRHMCEHFAQHVIEAETSAPGSSAIFRTFERKVAA